MRHKIPETQARRYKARFVLGGHRDRQKAFIVHTLLTVQTWSTRLLLANSEIHKIELWSEDAPQAYNLADKSLARLVIIDDVPPEFALKNSECLQAVKPAYGLSDLGDY